MEVLWQWLDALLESLFQDPVTFGLSLYCGFAASIAFSLISWGRGLSQEFEEFAANARGLNPRVRELVRALGNCAFGVVANLLGVLAVAMLIGRVDGIEVSIEQYAVSISTTLLLLLVFGMWATWISVEHPNGK